MATTATATTAPHMLADWDSIPWDLLGGDDLLRPLQPAAVVAVAAAATASPHKRPRLDLLLDMAAAEEEAEEEEEEKKRKEPAAARNVVPGYRSSSPTTFHHVGVLDAAHMSIFDEWFWLAFIGSRGIAEYNRIHANRGAVNPVRFLAIQKAAILDQQRQRLLLHRSCDAPQQRLRHEAQHRFNAMSVAFQHQPTNARFVRIRFKEWCKTNAQVLQWFADYFGSPFVLVHRSKGWCLEYLPTATATEESASAAAVAAASTCQEIMDTHTWRPKSNAVLMYMYHNDDSAYPRFGVELAPERILRDQAGWVNNVVRIHSPEKPLASARLYTLAALGSLCDRLAFCQPPSHGVAAARDAANEANIAAAARLGKPGIYKALTNHLLAF